MPTFTIDAYRFMLEHAGYSYHYGRETPEQGRVRSALALARAEYAFELSPSSVEWVDDDDADTSFLDQPGWEENRAAYRRGEYVFKGAILRDGSGEEIKSLWSIHLPRDWHADPYRRVVEAELAGEVGPLILDPSRESAERDYWSARGVMTVDV